jgi:acetate kinase
MMKILVLNCGSSTLKFQLIHVDDAPRRETKLARGIVDRIGGAASFKFQTDGAREGGSRSIASQEAAVCLVIDWLMRVKLEAIDAVGHRVVHGGEGFSEAVFIDDEVIAKLEELCALAPLHNPGAVNGIRAARKVLGDAIPMAAAFDTSFHHTIPEHAGRYAIPWELSEKHKIRRYGFHGLAHQYDIARYAEWVGKPVSEVSAVTLHLGNGCSATAIRNGMSVDTSMGFTPLEGLVMGTRSGDIDPALVSYLARKEKVDAAEVENWLNKRSGLLGISGISNDMRDLIAAYESDTRARLAVDIFCYRAGKYLGAYLATLEGAAQAVIFSGGIGENAPLVRQKIVSGMEWCGIELDSAANAATLGRDGRVSAALSKLDVFVVHTDEESVIARETARLCRDPRLGTGD